MRPNHLRPSLRAFAMAASLPCMVAQAQPLAKPVEQALTFTLGAETIRLPGAEHLGLAGGSMLFDVGSGWWLGPAVYAAATGQRGGFYVGGLEAQRRWRLGSGTELAAGLYAGGGGGAASPVGGGLMLRPALTLWQDLGPVQAGLGWSQVRFPSGDIRSGQWSLLLGWQTGLRHQTGSASWIGGGRSGLGFDRVAMTLGDYRVATTGASRRVGLVGMRAERDLAMPGLVAGVEAAAAAQGNAAGYMEILGHLGWQAAPLPQAWPSLKLGLRGAIGLGGGGAMPMGGGAFGKATATASFSPLPGWTLGADVGRAIGNPLRARSTQIWLATDLEPSGPGNAASRATVRTEWVTSLQHHTRVARGNGSTQSLDTMGLELNRYLGRHLYLTGQAHSAYAGAAGGYSIGLLGLGLATIDDTSWRLGGELLAGAAGGGGVLTGGGAVGQAKLWAGWSPAPAQELRLTAASLRSRSGGLSTPVLGLSWSHRFDIGGR